MEGDECYQLRRIRSFQSAGRITPIRRILDIGANTGQVTRELYRTFPQARIDAFEPVPDYFVKCARETEHLRKNVSVHQIGITAEHIYADDFGCEKRPRPMQVLEATPYFGSGWRGSHRIVPCGIEFDHLKFVEGTSELELATLDEILIRVLNPGEKVDLLKTDCEGAESSFLGCASEDTLRRCRYIVGEWHDLHRFYPVVERRLRRTHNVHLAVDPRDARLGSFFAELRGEQVILSSDLYDYKAGGTVLRRSVFQDLPADSQDCAAQAFMQGFSSRHGSPNGVAGLSDIISTPYPVSRYAGRGIVVCVDDVRRLYDAWVCIRSLRSHGCTLPVQVWCLGQAASDEEWSQHAAPYQVEAIDSLRVLDLYPQPHLTTNESRLFAILCCPFKDVLSLDADVVPLIDPTQIFDSSEYSATGAVFWPIDDTRDIESNLELDSNGNLHEVNALDSAQIAIDKERCWRALYLANWINGTGSTPVQRISATDQALAFAWRHVGSAYAMPRSAPIRHGDAIGQFDFHCGLAFARGLRKETTANETCIWPQSALAECRAFLRELQDQWCISARFAGGLSNEDRNQMAKLARREYRYHRVGCDSRRMRFSAVGSVIEGAAYCEQYFYCKKERLALVASDGHITCELDLQRDGSYYGRWVQFERMPIVLEYVGCASNEAPWC